MRNMELVKRCEVLVNVHEVRKHKKRFCVLVEYIKNV